MKRAAFQATQNNDLPALREVLANSPGVLRSTDHRRDSLMHVAAQYGDSGLLAFLNESGIDVDVSRIGDVVYTPLHVACRHGRIEAVRWLLDNGASLEAGAGSSATPLVNAAMGGNLEVVKVLLDAGADPSASYFVGEGKDRCRLDAIAVARIKGNQEVAEYLEALA